MTFEEMAEKANISILCIENEGVVLARGIHISNSLVSFSDNDTSIIGYTDTGVFVLFRGSHTCTTDKKYKNYIDNNGLITKEIVFQSRNMAAEFVLGEKGRTNHWKEI